MGGGDDKDVCVLLQIAQDTQPYVVQLRKTFPDVTFIYYDRPAVASFKDLPRDAAKLVPKDVWKKTKYLITLANFPDSLDLVPNLKWIHLSSAGSNQIQNHPVYTDTKDIIITNSSGIHGPQIAEWTIMNMLIARHKYNQTYEWQKQHLWGPSANLSPVIDHVGQRIAARVCSAMGMTVLAYTASPRPTASSRHDNGFIVPSTGDPDGTIPSAWYSGTSTTALHTFLSQSLSYLLISVPLTASTRHLISTPELAILRRSGTYIINIARGPILDTDALISTLNSGPDPSTGNSLVGAALDVTDPEPLPKDHPLWETRDVIISPHVSGLATNYMERSLKVWEGNLTRLLEKGEKGMWNVVDREKGY
ncbi:putative 2-hydroxyacid dehydrogenase [Phaeomoniella chlamydospora]|uniref:Putative 2-hydroxyacid dehydrogenase n=1 Tax=Phaeomoniella chlamydospora TaxID=158046 RepID=A0A0G2EHJ9_PHACM|nr:putative 2-hydroxyacid dehydrogenase [Phaeomoniella chlamydospora]